MMILKTLLIYSGPLDFTYYSAITYIINPSTGDNYAIGGSDYNYEKTQKGRAAVVSPEICIVP